MLQHLPCWGTYITLGDAYDVAVQDGVAYVADFDYGLQVINVSNVFAPSLLGTYDMSGQALGVAVQNEVAYVADYAPGLQIINVSNASAPSLLGTYDTPDFAYGVAVQNGIAYVADYGTGLQIISLKHSQLTGIVPFNAIGNYSLKVHATNTNGEWISTDLILKVDTQPSATAMLSSSAVTNAQSISPMSTPVNSTNFFSSSPTSQNSNAVSFTVVVFSTPIQLDGDGTTITTDMLYISGNVNSNQVIYTVQGNNPDIVITVNGIETNQFTQADVEGNFVEIALNGITCGDYSTDLQLEANVAGGNVSPQRVDVSLIFEGTTCANTERLSAFSFRDTNIGFWAQKREAEREPLSVQNSKHVSMFI